MAKIYEIFGKDAHDMTIALLTAANAADMVVPGASIVLKPNLVAESTPESGATTHPGVLSGCIEYFRAAGFDDISIMEGSWVGSDTRTCFRVAGYDKVCEKYGVKFYNLRRESTRMIQTPMRKMEVCEKILDAGFLINLPVLKGHCQTVMTCALKNMKGCLPDSEKRRFHREGLIKPIAALGAALKPDLTIVDSICGDLSFEEGGNPIQTNRMYLGTDSVQLDAYGLELMGLDPSDVPYIELCERWGGGSMKIEPDDIITLNEGKGSAPYKNAARYLSKLTRSVREDSACSACYASLTRALHVLRGEGVRVNETINIGQGWQGKEMDGIGIGRCCAGASCGFAKGCPPTARAVADLLREKA